MRIAMILVCNLIPLIGVGLGIYIKKRRRMILTWALAGLVISLPAACMVTAMEGRAKILGCIVLVTLQYGASLAVTLRIAAKLRKEKPGGQQEKKE